MRIMSLKGEEKIMEMDLGGVIAKIKKDGVEQAEEQAAAIIKDAEKKAKEILRSTQEQKEAVLKTAKEDAANLKATGEAALRQASRDVVLGLRARMEALLDTVVKKEVSQQLSIDVLKNIITTLITNSIKNEHTDLEILLSEKDKKDLRETLAGLLQKEIASGITIKVSPSIKKGFRLGKKGANLYYDFSDEAITEAFNFYLNKKLREIIDLGMPDAG